jgi:hypothetical protein
MMSDFKVFESETGLSERLGIRRETLKTIRPTLKRGVDWDIQDRVVQYSAVGVERVMEYVGYKGGAVMTQEPPVEKNAPIHVQEVKKAVAEPSKARMMTVCRLCPNPTWVYAVAGVEEGRRVVALVRVPDNRMLRQGMVLHGCVVHPGVMGAVRGRWLWRGARR